MSTELVLVPAGERTPRRINYALWVFGWRWRQAQPAIEHALQRLGAAVRHAMRMLDRIGFDAQRNMRYVGGHWYPVEHMRMTARQYRAWKRMQGRRR